MRSIHKFKQFRDFFKPNTKKEVKLNEKDLDFVEDIRQICMPLLDDGFIFEHTFDPTKNEYLFSFLPPNGNIKDNIWYTQNQVQDHASLEDYLERCAEYSKMFKSISENLSEINDRLFDYSDDWNVSCSLGNFYPNNRATGNLCFMFIFSMMRKKTTPK